MFFIFFIPNKLLMACNAEDTPLVFFLNSEILTTDALGAVRQCNRSLLLANTILVRQR